MPCLDDVADGHHAFHLGPAAAVGRGGGDARDVADALLRHDLHRVGLHSLPRGCQIGYMDHAGCRQWVYGCYSRVIDWLHGHTDCHQLDVF
jgi:hypothetical protein